MLMNYIGPDVHKKTISYCIKDERAAPPRRQDRSNETRTGRLDGNSFATMDGDGSNDFRRLDLRSLLPLVQQIKVAYLLMLRYRIGNRSVAIWKWLCCSTLEWILWLTTIRITVS
jgi:hypothetical protein